MRTRVLVRGYYGAANCGDDALLAACFQLLRRHYAPREIVVCARSRTYLPALVPGVKILTPGMSLPAAPLVVYGGGTQYFSFPAYASSLSPPPAPPPQRRPSRWLEALRWRLSRRTAQPLRHCVALGIGLGPFAAPEDAAVPRQLFESAGYLAVRDPVSLALCQAWGLTQAVLRSDLCFLPGWRPQDAPDAPPWSALPFQLGVIVRDWPYTPEGEIYRAPLLEVVARLRAEGLRITFITFQPEYDWETRLAAQGESVLAWHPDQMTLPAFLDQLASCAAFLTARYHGAIFAALLGRPCISIELEPKLRLVAELLSARPFIWRPPFQLADGLTLVRRLFTEYTSAQAYLRQVVMDQQRLAGQMQAEFDEFLYTNLSPRKRKSL